MATKTIRQGERSFIVCRLRLYTQSTYIICASAKNLRDSSTFFSLVVTH
ncbi:unnamed protein product, partial [Allacma fusca]